MGYRPATCALPQHLCTQIRQMGHVRSRLSSGSRVLHHPESQQEVQQSGRTYGIVVMTRSKAEMIGAIHTQARAVRCDERDVSGSSLLLPCRPHQCYTSTKRRSLIPRTRMRCYRQIMAVESARVIYGAFGGRQTSAADHRNGRRDLDCTTAGTSHLAEAEEGERRF